MSTVEHGAPEKRVVRQGGFVYQTVDRSKADRVAEVDGKRVKSLDDLLTYVESKKPGDKIVLTVIRDGERLELPVQLEESRN